MSFLKDKIEELQKNKVAVQRIQEIQRDRETKQEVKNIIQEYGVDEDTALRYVQKERHKEKVKVAVQKRNAIIKGIGSAIGKGAAKAVEAQREQQKRKQARTKQKQKEEDEVIWIPQS